MVAFTSPRADGHGGWHCQHCHREQPFHTPSATAASYPCTRGVRDKYNHGLHSKLPVFPSLPVLLQRITCPQLTSSSSSASGTCQRSPQTPTFHLCCRPAPPHPGALPAVSVTAEVKPSGQPVPELIPHPLRGPTLKTIQNKTNPSTFATQIYLA